MVKAGDKLLDGTVKSVNLQGLIIVQNVNESALARQDAGGPQAAPVGRGREAMTVTKGFVLALTLACAA